MTTSGLMHNPPHPGEFIRDVYLDVLQLSMRDVALRLQVAPSTLHRILQVVVESLLRWRCACRAAWAALPKVG